VGTIRVVGGQVTLVEAGRLRGEEALAALEHLSSATLSLSRAVPLARLTLPVPVPAQEETRIRLVNRDSESDGAPPTMGNPPSDDRESARGDREWSSRVERRLAGIDFFESAVILDARGNVLASLGVGQTHRSIAVTLFAVTSLARNFAEAGPNVDCELTYGGRTLFGVHAAGLFAIVVPTRGSMTRQRLLALRSLLTEAAAETRSR
jgi:hypothetical protein